MDACVEEVTPPTEDNTDTEVCDQVESFVEPEFVAVPQLESLKLGQEVKLVVSSLMDGKRFRAQLSANEERFVNMQLILVTRKQF